MINLCNYSIYLYLMIEKILNIFILNMLKVIVFNQSDFEWAEKFAAQVNKTCKLYLQPEWSKSKEMTPKIIEYVMKNPQWEISLQTHKFLNIP